MSLPILRLRWNVGDWRETYIGTQACSLLLSKLSCRRTINTEKQWRLSVLLLPGRELGLDFDPSRPRHDEKYKEIMSWRVKLRTYYVHHEYCRIMSVQQYSSTSTRINCEFKVGLRSVSEWIPWAQWRALWHIACVHPLEIITYHTQQWGEDR